MSDSMNFINEKIGAFYTNPVAKIVYKYELFDVSQMKIGTRINTTITSDGSITIREYRDGSRKLYSTRKYCCTVEDFDSLCKQLETCINTATNWDWYVDDCAEKLRIVYKYGREQIVDRGLGNADTNISMIFYGFLKKLSIEL